MTGFLASEHVGQIGDLPRYAAAKFSAKAAVIVGERSATFTDIDRQSDRLAGFLATNHFLAGDRAILFGGNAIEWIVAYYAILKSGGIVVPLNKLLTASEVAYVAKDCAASCIIGSKERLASLAAIKSLGAVPHHSWNEDGTGFDDLLATPFGCPHRAQDIDDPAAICYTSGTTGRPKGAVLSHRSILANIALSSTMHGKMSEDIIFSALPCPHVYGNVVFQSAFVTGATLLLFPAFDPKEALEAMERCRASIFEGVPTMYYYLLNESIENRDLTSLRLLTVGGQSMPISRMQEAQLRLGAPLVELWGMTELAGLGATHSVLSAQLGLSELGSIGTTLPGIEARITDTSGSTIKADGKNIGELQVRGPIVMHGYWNNSEATSEAISESGWLATGDMATIDTQGLIRIVDRKKDMILTAGYNVYPAEVEARLSAHEDVAMAAVVGHSDDQKGEIPVAYVVLKPECELTVDELLEFCREALAAYKLPRKIYFLNDLPKTSSGKILRRALKNQFQPEKENEI